MDERKMIYLDDAIDAICKHGTALERRGILVLALVEHKQMTIDLLESLPSAQRTGQWIVKKDSQGCMFGECTCCGMKQYAGRTDYCPNCGADMREEN